MVLSKVSEQFSLAGTLLEIAEDWGMSKPLYDESIRSLAEMLDEPLHPAKNPQFQKEMEKVYRVYHRVALDSAINILAQYKMGCKMYRILDRCLETLLPDVVEANKFLNYFQRVLMPLMQRHRELDDQMTLLGRRILVLVAEDHPPAASLGLLNLLV